MKKIIAAVVILLAVAGVFAPYINGLVMEKIVRQAQDNLNEMYANAGSGVSVEIIDYDRSFLSSEIEWRIRLGNLAAVYGINEIQLVDRAEHGFTGVVSKTSLEKNQWFVDFVNDKLDGKNPLHITTTYTLTGEIESVVALDAFSLQLESETVDFRPAKVTTELDEGFSHLASKAAWEGLTVSDKARMEGFALQAELEKISTYIWDGEIEYKLDNLMIHDQQENFELIKFQGKYELDFDEEKNSLSVGGEVAFDNLVNGNEKVENMLVRIAVNNLDARGYEDFMEIYSRTVQSTLRDISRVQEDPALMEQAMKEQMAAASLQMIAAYENFLKKGLEINISDMHAQLQAGKINGNLELKLNRDVTFAQLAPIATRPDLAFEIFSLQSHLSFPAELAAEKPQLVSPIYPGMETGLFVQEGEYLVHSAQTRDGKLFLNGHEVIFQ